MQLYRWLSGASFAVASYDFDITPAYKSAGFGVSRLIWFIRNWEYIVGIIIFVVIVGLLIYWVRKK